MAVLSIEEILVAEADELSGGKEWRNGLSADTPSGQGAQDARTHLNADDSRQRHSNNDRPSLDAKEVERRKALYRALNKLDRAALCCSGGGIRSATFCLGVIQALARHDVNKPAPPSRTAPPLPPPSTAAAATETGIEAGPATPSESDQNATPKLDPKNSLLGRFHYLSTVSGGGYIGSWLSAWRSRADFETIIGSLTDRPKGPDVEPPEISWLRAYSNYLTPRAGLGSADTWAAIAVVVRNLVLNWLLIIPVVCLILLALKIIATASVWAAHGDKTGWYIIPILLIGVICLIVAQSFTNHHRPPRRPLSDPGEASDTDFIFRNLIYAVLSAVAVTIFFSSQFFSTKLPNLMGWLGLPDLAKWLNPSGQLVIVTAVVGMAIYAVGWIAGRRWPGWRDAEGWRDFGAWTFTGFIYGGLIGFGAQLYALLQPYPSAGSPAPLLVAVIFGVPWVLMAQLTADNVFGGLVSYEAKSDSDREWLGRAAGWLSAGAIAWVVVAFLVFAGGYFVQEMGRYAPKIITAFGGTTAIVSGIATALLGSSSKTPAKPGKRDAGGYKPIVYNIALAAAAAIFTAALIIGLSIALDELLLRRSLVDILRQTSSVPMLPDVLLWLAIGCIIALAIGAIASSCVNINRFSLHAIYRNRLVRAYLGASCPERHPDPFTGLDSADNIRVHELRPTKQGGSTQSRALFHVINIALNVVSTKRLAWQERKAESFTVSPLHCGSAYLGFRNSKEYGDSLTRKTQHQGIALGTAMAISGAAASPNMGYHSSPAIELLLTLFNVRLGWWLGNPGKWGDRHDAFRREGPRQAARPLLCEGVGQTTDDEPYVYLSDGGHFEDLGLYEMVRRRCRFVVVVDADCDPAFAFEDLGNAVRKIYIDLGVRITFENLGKLKNRPNRKAFADAGVDGIPRYALGTIDYQSADNSDGAPSCENGLVLYIKPAYHGTCEGAGVRSYAAANETFPHDTTANQFFTESQFESYRSLAMDMVDDILNYEVMLPADAVKPPGKRTLHDVLRMLPTP